MQLNFVNAGQMWSVGWLKAVQNQKDGFEKRFKRLAKKCRTKSEEARNALRSGLFDILMVNSGTLGEKKNMIKIGPILPLFQFLFPLSVPHLLIQSRHLASSY